MVTDVDEDGISRFQVIVNIKNDLISRDLYPVYSLKLGKVFNRVFALEHLSSLIYDSLHTKLYYSPYDPSKVASYFVFPDDVNVAYFNSSPSEIITICTNVYRLRQDAELALNKERHTRARRAWHKFTSYILDRLEDIFL